MALPSSSVSPCAAHCSPTSRTSACATGRLFSVTARMVTVRPVPSAVVSAVAWNCGDKPPSNAARNKQSASITSSPPVDRRNAAAFSSDMRATAIGGDTAARSACVRTISMPPMRLSRSFIVCLAKPSVAGAIMYRFSRALERLR